MATRVLTALVAALLLSAPAAALTVRFDTNVGNIDLELNTANPDLQAHVANILAYVDAGRYDRVVLNRADDGGSATNPADDFVLQFGGFTVGRQQFSSFNAFTPVTQFDPVIVDFNNDRVVDFDRTNLKNTRGTVSLALSNNPNTGSASFFVNLGDNTALDNQGFVPFAKVVDMSTVDYIMRLSQVSDSSAGLASANIPVINSDNLLVFVERAYCLDCDAEAMALMATAVVADPVEEALELESEPVVAAASTANVVSVPEPPALVLAVGVLMVLAVLKGPRR